MQSNESLVNELGRSITLHRNGFPALYHRLRKRWRRRMRNARKRVES